MKYEDVVKNKYLAYRFIEEMRDALNMWVTAGDRLFCLRFQLALALYSGDWFRFKLHSFVQTRSFIDAVVVVGPANHSQVLVINTAMVLYNR